LGVPGQSAGLGGRGSAWRLHRRRPPFRHGIEPSGRARSLRNLGVGCVLAESIARLFFRNCVNFGLLAIECPGIAGAFEEGQTAEFSTEDWTVRNRQTGQVLLCTPVPAMLLDLMRGGGIYPVLERNGLVAPAQPGHAAGR
jgi:3-isopropylmalate/(R)-2-methylmalate dehydratase small subunit